VLPDARNTAKDFGVFNIAGALPLPLAPALVIEVSASQARQLLGSSQTRRVQHGCGATAEVGYPAS
jgi:hypothetical protein